LDKKQILELKLFANDIRRIAMRSMAAAGHGHVGGSMSIAEAIAALYSGIMNVRPDEPHWPGRDKIVISKGHAGPIIYAALAKRGYFPMEWTSTLNQNGTRLPSHVDRLKTPGVDMSTGSLGQGASTACGLAVSDRIWGRNTHVYLILGDGELNEGQVWEAMMFIADKKLTNLITIVDYNKAQVDGFCKEVCDMGDLVAKFQAFGLDTYFVRDGNDIKQVYKALNDARHRHERPMCLILNTIKAKDAAGFEGKPSSHHTHISPSQMVECENLFNKIDEDVRRGLSV
jgi:transketolase